MSALSWDHASANGLIVSPVNPRYFADAEGNIVFLTGSHTWNNKQDFIPDVFDYPDYLDFLEDLNHNFFRLWCWEESAMLLDGLNAAISPGVYARTGQGTANDGLLKYDLTLFNQNYFDRLRSRVLAARARGMYVSIMLFNGWSIVTKTDVNPWPYHPYNQANNINGINGDPNGNGNGEETHTLQIPAITALQEAYIRKVIDTINDLDNVLFEVSNETDGTAAATAWQYHIIEYVKEYESGKANQHPVGMTFEYPGGSNTDLFNSPADWISPNETASSSYDYKTNPPPASGDKVIISDTDHLWGIGGDRYWAWKSFLRGMNLLYMDPYHMQDVYGLANKSLRLNMGYIRRYAEKMNLAAMTPQSDKASTGYCLAQAAHEYCVYAPRGGSFTVDLALASKDYYVEWFRPSTGAVIDGGKVAGGAAQSFTPPFSGDAVLYLNLTTRPDPTAVAEGTSDDSSSNSSSNCFITTATASNT
ncbi:MAG: DUF6298 domain-containing protein [Syntrophaceae bacterium]